MGKKTTIITHDIVESDPRKSDGKKVGVAHTWDDGDMALEFHEPLTIGATLLLVKRKQV